MFHFPTVPEVLLGTSQVALEWPELRVANAPTLDASRGKSRVGHFGQVSAPACCGRWRTGRVWMSGHSGRYSETLAAVLKEFLLAGGVGLSRPTPSSLVLAPGFASDHGVLADDAFRLAQKHPIANLELELPTASMSPFACVWLPRCKDACLLLCLQTYGGTSVSWNLTPLLYRCRDSFRKQNIHTPFNKDGVRTQRCLVGLESAPLQLFSGTAMSQCEFVSGREHVTVSPRGASPGRCLRAASVCGLVCLWKVYFTRTRRIGVLSF